MVYFMVFSVLKLWYKLSLLEISRASCNFNKPGVPAMHGKGQLQVVSPPPPGLIRFTVAEFEQIDNRTGVIDARL